jgi:hypothetical protein
VYGAGCQGPDFEPRAEAARRACGIVGLEAVSDAPSPLHEACVAHIAEDLRMDIDQVGAIDGWPVRAAEAHTRGGSAIRSAHFLLSLDLGEADELGLDLPTDDPTAGGALYDYVAGAFSRTSARVGSHYEASTNTRTRELYLYQPLAGLQGTGVLVHEARHADLGAGHTPCSFDQSLDCDDDPDGPFGWQEAFYDQVNQHTDDPLLADDMDAWANEVSRYTGGALLGLKIRDLVWGGR